MTNGNLPKRPRIGDHDGMTHHGDTEASRDVGIAIEKGLHEAASRDSFDRAVAQWSKTDIFGDIRNPTGKNLFTNETLQVSKITLEPYQILWMRL